MKIKKSMGIIIGAALAVLLLVGGIFIFSSPAKRVGDSAPIPFSKLEIKLLESGELSFFASVGKQELLSLIKDREDFGKLAEVGIKFLPESIDISGELLAMRDDDRDRVFAFRRLVVNGYEIPQKLLSRIGEFRLDFERSLSYNK